MKNLAAGSQSIHMTDKGFDRLSMAIAALGLLVLYLPVLWTLNEQVWYQVEQSYGPVILAASLWFFWQRRKVLLSISEEKAAPLAGMLCLLIGLLLYVLGRSQQIMTVDTFSAFPVVVGLLLLTRGWTAVRVCLLPLILLLFVVPLPPFLVAALTGPLKMGVSVVAEAVLWHLGYPISRTGVTLMVGPYQLLVADACAGLTSIFTLETVGLVYMGMRGYASRARNVALAILLLPVSFVSNVVRVLVLVLVTYHFGDEAGRGFMHSMAGLVLFLVAAALMVLVDELLGVLMKKPIKPEAA